VDTDPYAVTATEQAAMSRRLETLVGSVASNDTLDLTDRPATSSDDAIEARLAAIEDTLDGLAERFEALTRDAAMDAGLRFAALETRIERLHDAMIDGFSDAKTRLVDELGGAMSRLEQTNTAVRATFGADVTALRGDLADALEEVRGQVESTIGTANSSIAATLEQHGTTTHEVLEAVQTEVRSGLADMSRSLTGQASVIRGATGDGAERLVGAGQALLTYLGERDRWLEGERDRLLHDVLDDFADGLSGRARRSFSSRMRGVVERRRDARDAERFRSTSSGATVIAIPALPPELAALSAALATPTDASPAVADPPGASPTGEPDVASPAVTSPKIATSARKTANAKTSSARKSAPAAQPAKKATPKPNSTVQNGAKAATTVKKGARKPGQ
jgi:hypothetical protein